MKTVFFVLIFASVAVHGADWTSPSSSPTGARNFREKAERKTKSRWTLADWLAQKERNRMMDLWLGMYAPSPYEFILSANYLGYKTSVDQPLQEQENNYSYSGQLAFYALVLGVVGEYERSTPEAFTETAGALQLRLMGNSNQSTHFNIEYGVATRVLGSNSVLNRSFYGAELDIYVERHSGLHGAYRQYMAGSDSLLGEFSQRKWEAGLFFDIQFLRVSAYYFSEDFHFETLASSTKRVGVKSGLRFFF